MTFMMNETRKLRNLFGTRDLIPLGYLMENIMLMLRCYDSILSLIIASTAVLIGIAILFTKYEIQSWGALNV